MAPNSAGVLLYRHGRHNELEVLLVHPGGPYWARRDDGWWSIPKGEIDPGEDPLAAALRELHEELGASLPAGNRQELGEVVQTGGKHVLAWAAEGDLDPAAITGGSFELEWPPRSGRLRSFPEVDRAAWYAVPDARRKILPGQLPFLDRLEALLASAPLTGDDGRPRRPGRGRGAR